MSDSCERTKTIYMETLMHMNDKCECICLWYVLEDFL